jgi:hypothetical protein
MPAKDLNENAWHPPQEEGELFPQPPELPTLKIPAHLKDAGFLSKKAGSFSGVPQRTVQSWSEKGFLIPEGRDTTGTGKRRLYSVVNCIEIGVLKALARKRLGDKAIRKTMEFVRKIRKYVFSGTAAYLHLYIDYGNPDEMVRTFTIPYIPATKYSTKRPEVGLHFKYLNECDEVVTINMAKIVRKVLAEIEA